MKRRGKAKTNIVDTWVPDISVDEIDEDIDKSPDVIKDKVPDKDGGEDKDGNVDNYRDNSRDRDRDKSKDRNRNKGRGETKDKDRGGDRTGDEDKGNDNSGSESIAGNRADDGVQDQKQDNITDKSHVNLQDDFVDPEILDEIKKKLRQSTPSKKRRTHEETYKKLSVRVYKHLHDLFYEEAAARGGHGAVQELANEILTFWYKNKHKL